MFDFTEKIIAAKDIMIDDWLKIGEALFRVVDTGHVLMDTMPLNHTLLILTSVWDEEDRIAQVVVNLDQEFVILNQK